jgi:hypothetical protein
MRENSIEQNIMPKFEVVSTGAIDRIRRIGRFLLPQQTEMCLSTHIREHDNQPELPFPKYTDMGEYLERE